MTVDKDIVNDSVSSMDFSRVIIGEYNGLRDYHREIEYNPVTRWFTVSDHGEAVGGTMFAATAADMYNQVKPREV